MRLRPQKMPCVIHFGFGGMRLIVCQTYYGEYQSVKLPDGRLVSLNQWCGDFLATGAISMPRQPTRVEISHLPPDDYTVRAGLNRSGKNYLIQRLSFETWGREYRVGPEVYGDCLIWSEDGPTPKPVLIRLPGIRSETFYEVTRWSDPGSPLEILEVEMTHDIYQLGPTGEPLRDKNKNPLLRPYVWATGPHQQGGEDGSN